MKPKKNALLGLAAAGALAAGLAAPVAIAPANAATTCVRENMPAGDNDPWHAPFSTRFDCPIDNGSPVYFRGEGAVYPRDMKGSVNNNADGRAWWLCSRLDDKVHDTPDGGQAREWKYMLYTEGDTHDPSKTDNAWGFFGGANYIQEKVNGSWQPRRYTGGHLRVSNPESVINQLPRCAFNQVP